MRLVLTRTAEGACGTAGSLCMEQSDGKLISPIWSTLELPWKDNANRISCIPTGRYKVVPRRFGGYFSKYSARYDHKFSIEIIEPERDDCGQREDILIHTGNFTRHTKGCVLIGKTMGLEDSGVPRLFQSRIAYEELYEVLAPLYFANMNPYVDLVIRKSPVVLDLDDDINLVQLEDECVDRAHL